MSPNARMRSPVQQCRGWTCLQVPLLALLLLAILSRTADGWKQGRGTWFDVHHGDLTTQVANCHLPWGDITTGRFAAAISDVDSSFTSSCGTCLEVRCQNALFKDGYGAILDRSTACRGSHSVFVTIADACPCQYPNNEYSNKRWCCGDDPSRSHIDITREAFAALADLEVGVIALEWRVVDCRTRMPADGSARAQAFAQAQSSSWGAPDSRTFPSSAGSSSLPGFTTSAGSGLSTASSMAASQRAADIQREAEEKVARAKKEAMEKFPNTRI